MSKPAPYPADTRARGWRLELDYERIDQSDTWGLADEIPMAQPALLMMWFVAWKREPCGSLPNDENVIRAKCKIPTAMWPKLRTVLMRGWWLADDGLLYHETLSKRVLEMLDYRRKTAERVANFKLKQREQHGGNALPTREQQGKNDTGTGTGTSLSSKDKGARKRAQPFDANSTPLPEWLDPALWALWVADRADRKKPVTQRGAALQIAKLDGFRVAGFSPKLVIEHSIAGGYQGLFAPAKAQGAHLAVVAPTESVEAYQARMAEEAEQRRLEDEANNTPEARARRAEAIALARKAVGRIA